MAEELDLFGDPILRKRTGPGKREIEHAWETRWDLVLWPVTIACPTYASLTETCVLLTEWADHEPGFGRDRPTASERASSYHSIIEDRVVTRAMSGPCPSAEKAKYPEFAAVYRQATTGSRGRRSDRPWTWGEGWRVLKYSHKLINGVAENPRRIPEAEFLTYMDRDPRRDAGALDDLMRRATPLSVAPTEIARSADRLVPPAVGVAGPDHKDRVGRTRELVEAFVQAAPIRLIAAWNALHTHLWEPHGCP